METFLSTPSARRATRGEACRPLHGEFLSTPSARRATTERFSAAIPAQISIHALREEGDRKLLQTSSVLHYFYPRPPRGGRPRTVPSLALMILFLSTPSARRATYIKVVNERIQTISIHALREEGD